MVRVLYASDGGRAARDAGKLLERIGRRDGVEVTALSVSDLKGIEAEVDLEDPVGPLAKSQTRAAEVLDEMTERLTRAGFALWRSRPRATPLPRS